MGAAQGGKGAGMNAVQQTRTPQPVAITVDQFRLLDENGAFDQFSKTELIEGVIYAMQGQHRPHARVKSGLPTACESSCERWPRLCSH
jgi:hypothetical protein